MNHLLDCIAGGRVSYITASSRVALPADESALTFLRTAHAALKARARQYAILPSAQADLPIFLACAAAWDLQGTVGGKKAVVLVTAQPDALEVCHHYHLPAHALPKGRYNMLNVAQLGRRIQNMRPRLTPSKGDFEFRLINTDHFTSELAAAMTDAGIEVQALIIDGRTVDIREVALPTDVPVLHLVVSRFQVMPDFRALDVVEPRSEDAGRLQCRRVAGGKPRGHQVPDPSPRLWALLDRLRRSPGSGIFLHEGWSLAWMLNGLPVNPDHVDKQYVARAGFQAHPLFGSLDVLRAVRDGTRDEALKSDMAEFIHEADQAILALKTSNPKHAKVAGLAADSSGALVLVNGRGVQAALQRDLDAHGVVAKVLTWREPATWMPHGGRVIIAGSPPPDRSWLLTAQWPISPDVHLVLTRAESRRLRASLRKLGVTGGSGFRALEELEKEDEAGPGGGDTVPDDIHSWLEAHESLGSSHGQSAWKPSAGMALMRVFKLSSGGRFYARASGEMARFEPSGIKMVQVADIKEGDVVLLSTDENPNVTDAVMARFEAREPDHRRRINAWKDEVMAKASGMTPEALAQTLVGLGAVGFTAELANDVFWKRTKFAPQDETFLVRATQVFLNRPLDTIEIGASIQRLRGIRRHAPRILNRYAKLSFVHTHRDMHQAFEEDYGITQAELQSIVRPKLVTGASEPLPCPQNFAGFYSEDVNA